ncbi:hypothetical protein [Roseospira marina]|uniref:hypothetical protein n=1 Tax=Roseospira marina TaxID=140057 RepID=UPI00147867DE|nr:hypothetical protein [Roseospira marina]MBB4314455.1 hypothetical protein [Roseospira marina]MBB5087615.1 hypothetical protein [Roseospira marina]
MTEQTENTSTTKDVSQKYDEATRQFQDGAAVATQKVNTGVQSAWGALQKVFNASLR